MRKVIKQLGILAIISILLNPIIAHAQSIKDNIKVPIGGAFSYFDLSDINNQRWVSTYLRGKPTIILTGHRYQKYEILKWAEAFNYEYQRNNMAYVLWVLNLSKHPWNTSRETIFKQWRTFNTSVPLLLDWDGIIGKSLRVNYNIPNIIVLDSYGRLVMHEMMHYNEDVYRIVSNRIRGYVNEGMALSRPRKKQKKGRRGDSF